MFNKIKEYGGLIALVIVVAVLVASSLTVKKLGNSTASFQEADQGFYIGSYPIALNVGGYPTLFAGNVVNSALGFNTTITTSSVLTPAQFCATTNQLYANTTANVTTTLPAATTTWAACGSGAYGGWEQQLITNDSTNTITYVAGTGMTFRCETQGVGTTTTLGGCTASQVTVNATSTVSNIGYWDGASSTLVVMWGNQWH